MKTRVLVVDDSIFMRRMISEMIQNDAALELAGTAKHGKEALELIPAMKPDVVTLDVEMPVMDGLETLQHIMKEHALPVLMISSLTPEGAETTIQALHYGAIDFFHKPLGPVSFELDDYSNEIIEKIKSCARAKPRMPKPALSQSDPVKPFAYDSGSHQSAGQLFAIGTSTGGPKALELVLNRLPADFPHPIVIVQHMPAKFTRSLAQRLDKTSPLHVVEAADRMLLEKGTAYIAPGGYQMEVRENGEALRVHLHQRKHGFHMPCVDVLFYSTAELSLRTNLIILTGMGRDGSDGMHSAKQSGSCTTIAESEESALIYGMPRAAVELNCVDYVLPIERIPHKMLELC